MRVPRILPAALGVAAILGTSGVLFMNIANAHTGRQTGTVRIAAIVASAGEGLIFFILIPLFYRTLRQCSSPCPSRPNSLSLILSLILIKIATAASVAALVLLAKDSDKTNILGGPETSFLIGGSVVLGYAFAAQVVYVVVHHVNGHLGNGETHSLHTDEGCQLSGSNSNRVKAVPYSQTVPRAAVTKERLSADCQSPPGSSGGKSTAETMSSIRSSFSQAVRPISSKTRLLSSTARTGRRPPSLDSIANRNSIAEEGYGFDSWDTSAVDPQDRQTVADTSPPLPRFLETIPASPTTSRSPSPATPVELEPPKRVARRSRSYSPMPRRQPMLTTHPSLSELDIHPLFRTDSPEPPRATPGTSIHAAEDAGKVISEKSLDRMRSGSLPSAPSPLSRNNSHESVLKSPTPSSEKLSPPLADSERKMTPPLPEWILNAGSRTSLTEYQIRKLRDRETTDEPSGLGITQ